MIGIDRLSFGIFDFLFFIDRRVFQQQRVYVAFVIIQGQAEYHVHVPGCCTTGIVGYGKSQGPGRLRPVFDGGVFQQACLGYGAVADQRVYIAVQVVDGHGRPQPGFMRAAGSRIFTGCAAEIKTGCAAEPVDGVRAGPRPGKNVLRRCV